MSKFSEDQIAPYALKIIESHPGIHTSDLIDAVRDEMKPDGEDLEILNNRNDDRFSQKVRNLKSHDSISHLVYTVGERNRQWYIKED